MGQKTEAITFRSETSFAVKGERKSVVCLVRLKDEFTNSVGITKNNMAMTSYVRSAKRDLPLKCFHHRTFVQKQQLFCDLDVCNRSFCGASVLRKIFVYVSGRHCYANVSGAYGGPREPALSNILWICHVKSFTN